MWVRSEYAGELAVLSTWLCSLLPWAVTYGEAEVLAQKTSVWIFWFLPRRFLFLPSIEFESGSGVPNWVWEFLTSEIGLYGGETYAALFWAGGTLFFLGALVFSLLYYFAEERIESLRFDPVRVLGTLLLASGLLLGVTFLGLWQNHPGITLPVGVLFQFVFGVLLLKTERVDQR
jgi:hypothetical protein